MRKSTNGQNKRWYHLPQGSQDADIYTTYTVHKSVYHKVATSDCMQLTRSAHFHLKWVDGHGIGKLGSESLRNNINMEMSLYSANCTMWCAISKQALTGPIYYGGHHKNQWYITNSDYSGSMARGHNIFPARCICPHNIKCHI